MTGKITMKITYYNDLLLHELDQHLDQHQGESYYPSKHLLDQSHQQKHLKNVNDVVLIFFIANFEHISHLFLVFLL